ncbi:hypothetical protein MSAN_01600800 [Mycena sanguinolenta]|uniref:Uncharacterized protein n=1 Tax=Mycena sanguinolenta TaxID=230812 RepID=A0A8H6Y4D0_9AGAR|nr:hypothetical protein MSAN_01600800 [Mycena sanguinolenta]
MVRLLLICLFASAGVAVAKVKRQAPPPTTNASTSSEVFDTFDPNALDNFLFVISPSAVLNPSNQTFFNNTFSSAGRFFCSGSNFSLSTNITSVPISQGVVQDSEVEIDAYLDANNQAMGYGIFSNDQDVYVPNNATAGQVVGCSDSIDDDGTSQNLTIIFTITQRKYVQRGDTVRTAHTISLPQLESVLRAPERDRLSQPDEIPDPRPAIVFD